MTLHNQTTVGAIQYNQLVGQVILDPGVLNLGDAQNVTGRGRFSGKH
jgi:hypothetical protein